MEPEAPYFASRKAARCPACGSHRVARISYGYPLPETWEAVERGEIVLGGCCVSACDPSWQCLDCSAMVYPSRLRGHLDDDCEAF